nr:MAG TPA: hypothetical protein [Caudoviricetes sp.]
MLYLVSVSGISAGDQLDDTEDFIVEAKDENSLAGAIADYRDGDYATEFNDAVWRVRELGDEFEYHTTLIGQRL